ncbi:hypothetical protein BH24ACT15_BH24ACT15_00430 [soil metagenome]
MGSGPRTFSRTRGRTTTGRPTGRGRRTNLALLVLVPLAVLTGLWSNTIGTQWLIGPATVHAVIAIAIAVLSPWKSLVVRRGLRRWKRSTWTSLLLLTLILAALITGVLHASGLQALPGWTTVMQVHVAAALVALLLVVSHFRAHPVRPRRRDVGRRTVVKTVGLVSLASLTWLGQEVTLDRVGLAGGRRRFTGSHQLSPFDQSGVPVTSWLDDQVQDIGADEWRLRIDGQTLSLADLDSYPHDDIAAVLDCTGGWYSPQTWTGIPLAKLLDVHERRSVLVRSATGYARRFPSRDLGRLWLVTNVNGTPLSAGHGFPARIVAPGRRGFWWVKWVTDIHTSDVPWWVQLPFPAT